MAVWMQLGVGRVGRHSEKDWRYKRYEKHMEKERSGNCSLQLLRDFKNKVYIGLNN